MKKALVVGSLNLDFTAKVDKLPKLGETIFGYEFYKSCGGKGANQAVCLAKLGLKTEMFGFVGNDIEGDELISNLEKNSVISRVKRSNLPTGRAVITVDKMGNNNIVVMPFANNSITKKDVDENIDAIESSDIIILQNEIPMEVIKYVLLKSKELNKITIFNPAPAVKLDKEIYENIDYLILNETEFEYIFDINYEDKINILNIKKKLNIRNILITLSEKGSILINDKNETIKQEAFKVKAIDTTAAGDSFIGAFALKLLETDDIKESLRFASIVSAIVVSKKGAQESIPNILEINDFIKGIKNEKD